MKSVLFVDDEPNLLAGLRRTLHSLRGEWQMSFALTAVQALEFMAKSSFDVVVTDMHMPGLDGAELLSRVKQQFPHAVRIILSGTAEREQVLRSVGHAHQFVAKPCTAEELRATVQRALALRELLADERLRQVTSRITSLPSLPSLYLEIQEVLKKEQGSIEDVGNIIARDVSMSAKVLQLVNSAFFGVSQRITSAVEATVYLGLDTISALVLTTSVFSRSSGLKTETLERLWTHSLRTGTLARTILKLEGVDAKTADQGFLAGMLHEVGLLVLATELRDDLARAWKHARRFGLSMIEAERRVLGASHAAVGAYLMGIWGLPDPVVEAIAFHHTPADLPHDRIGPVTAVHVATALDCETGGSAFGESAAELDRAYVERLGLAGRVASWREECARLTEENEAA